MTKPDTAFDVADVVKCARLARAALRRGDAAAARHWISLLETAARAAETLRLSVLRDELRRSASTR